MVTSAFWVRENFPVVYEAGKATAVVVDVNSFSQMEIVLDNLLNREREPEDAILVASNLLKVLLEKAQAEPTVEEWERELDDL